MPATRKVLARRLPAGTGVGCLVRFTAVPPRRCSARDLPEVTGWVRDQSADEPTTIRDANFQASRLLTLRTRNSAAYKGVHALLMRDGSRDFRTGEPIEAQTFFDDSIDIHHVFPPGLVQEAAD